MSDKEKKTAVSEEKEEKAAKKEKKAKAADSGKSKKEKEKKSIFKRIAAWFKDLKKEFKKSYGRQSGQSSTIHSLYCVLSSSAAWSLVCWISAS